MRSFPDPGPDTAPFLGSWTLERYVARSPEGETAMLGENGTGLITYTADGAMSAHLVADKTRPGGHMAFYTSYYGSFSVDTEQQVVTHQVHAATEPGLSGKALKRRFRFEGNRLVLSAQIGERLHELTWQRAGEAGR